MSGGSDRWIRWTKTGCVAMLAPIAGTVSYLHMHMLIELRGSAGMGRGADPVLGGRDDRGCLDYFAGRLAFGWPWRVLAVRVAGGGLASLAADVAVAEATATGRVIAARPSFALIAAYELLMRQVRRSATASGKAQHLTA